MASHSEHIALLIDRLNETSTRFAARLEGAGARAEQAAAGWTPAQIAVHVAMVNDSLAGVVEGTVPGAVPAAAGFQERDWAEVIGGVPARNEAPARFHPPAHVGADDALSQFRRSIAHLTDALRALPEERGGYCITSKAVGTITLRQVGDFAIAHMIRHNQQMKRILEGR